MDQFPPATPGSHRKPDDGGRARILVIDDDESNRALHQLLLTRAGYDVDAAVDGEEGWQRLAAASYDLVVTDNDMPRLTGLGLIRRMRQAGLEIPVMVVTGSMEALSLAEELELELAAILPKPFLFRELFAVVDAVLHRRLHAREGARTVA